MVASEADQRPTGLDPSRAAGLRFVTGDETDCVAIGYAKNIDYVE